MVVSPICVTNEDDFVAIGVRARRNYPARGVGGGGRKRIVSRIV